jgi:hypothetical protein
VNGRKSTTRLELQTPSLGFSVNSFNRKRLPSPCFATDVHLSAPEIVLYTQCGTNATYHWGFVVAPIYGHMLGMVYKWVYHITHKKTFNR